MCQPALAAITGCKDSIPPDVYHVKYNVLTLKHFLTLLSSLYRLDIRAYFPGVPPKQKQRLPRSESTEDHLERIQELVDLKGYARVTDLATALELSAPTVSNMVRRLAQRGYVNYERYRGFTLTPLGIEIASDIKHRHKILTSLLSLLRIPAEVIEQEVEDVEHHLTPQTLAVFSSLVEFWQDHPEQLKAFRKFQDQRKSR